MRKGLEKGILWTISSIQNFNIEKIEKRIGERNFVSYFFNSEFLRNTKISIFLRYFHFLYTWSYIRISSLIQVLVLMELLNHYTVLQGSDCGNLIQHAKNTPIILSVSYQHDMMHEALYLCLRIMTSSLYLTYQRGGSMDITLGLSARRSGVRIPGWGKWSRGLMRGKLPTWPLLIHPAVRLSGLIYLFLRL